MTETIEIDGYTVTIAVDEDAANPLKEWESPGTLATWHRRYSLGNVQPSESPKDYLESLVPSKVTAEFEVRRNDIVEREYNTRKKDHRFDYDLILEILSYREQAAVDKWLDEYLVLINVYMYDHSGLALSSVPFSCPWDSGQLGVYFLTPEEVEKEFGGDKEKALAYLKSSLETYGDYVSGSVYGISEITAPGTVDEDGDEIEGEEIPGGSCCGFYGDDHEKSGLLESARETIKYHRA